MFFRFNHPYPKLENALSELHHTSKPLIVQCVSFITVLSTATVTGYIADARFPFDNAIAIVEATEANACIIGLYCTRHSIINRMLSYLMNYKSIPPDKRPVLFNQHASDAPMRKLLDRHVGAADGLRNGGLEDQVTAEHFI